MTSEPAPFAASMAWLLDNPLSRWRAERWTRRLPLRPGMRVLDMGCGPGRLTLPIARAVGGGGEVLAVDVQPAMLRRVERRAAGARLRNVRTMEAAAGDADLPAARFDVALLFAVLGEIPAGRPRAAVEGLARALVPGGALLVMEGLIDPHRQPPGVVVALGSAAGLEPVRERRRGASVLIELRKAAAVVP